MKLNKESCPLAHEPVLMDSLYLYPFSVFINRPRLLQEKSGHHLCVFVKKSTTGQPSIYLKKQSCLFLNRLANFM